MLKSLPPIRRLSQTLGLEQASCVLLLDQSIIVLLFMYWSISCFSYHRSVSRNRLGYIYTKKNASGVLREIHAKSLQYVVVSLLYFR